MDVGESKFADHIATTLTLLFLFILLAVALSTHSTHSLFSARSRHSLSSCHFLFTCDALYSAHSAYSLRSAPHSLSSTRYIVHASTFIRTVITFVKPFISKKFGKKIHFCSQVSVLASTHLVTVHNLVALHYAATKPRTFPLSFLNPRDVTRSCSLSPSPPAHPPTYLQHTSFVF
jgi:hypothetical protein